MAAEPYDGQVPAGVEAWRIRYTTTDSRGREREATGLVVASAVEEERGAVLGIAHATVGIASRCAPSTAESADTTVGTLAITARQGWVTVAPDYVGLGTPGPHEYLVGLAAGHDLLDGVRAARAAVPEADDETLLWGHSQGGHAVLWAADEASSYAPEVELVGVAATAPPTDLRTLVPLIADTTTGTLVAALLLTTWDRSYPEAGLLDLVPEEHRDGVDAVAGTCLAGDSGYPAALAAADRMRGQLVPGAAYDGVLGRLLVQNSPGSPGDVPLFVGQGIEDNVVPAEVTRAWVEARCAEGATIDYREFPGGHGFGFSPATVVQVAAWADDRVAGGAAPSTCG